MKLDEAKKLLELPEKVSLNEIRKTYRRLALKYHPDRCADKDKKKCEEKIKKINKAYEILLDYCANYRFPLSDKDKDTMQHKAEKEYKEHLKRFYDGWWFDIDKE